MKDINQHRPIAFIIASTNHGTMLVNRNDYMIIDGQRHGVGSHLLNASCFDPDEVSVALQLLTLRRKHYGNGVFAIDCGANIGVHTIEWAKYMHNWGEVLAIEAQERIYYALAGNIVINNCFNSRALWAAVGQSSGIIGVPQPNYNQPGSFGSIEIKENQSNEFIGQEISYAPSDLNNTRLISIDELNLQRIDLIKIDIEGMEVESLLGAIESLQRCKPQIIIERIKSNEEKITSILEELGYHMMPLGINYLAIHLTDPALASIK